MTTPVLGAPELTAAQAVPEVAVNEIARFLEAGASWFKFIDEQDAPPGSPSDGDTYLVGTGSGAWAGQDGDITFYMNTEWKFITPTEGMGGYFADTNTAVVFDGSSWTELGGGGAPVSGGGGSSSESGWTEYTVASGGDAFIDISVDADGGSIYEVMVTGNIGPSSAKPNLRLSDDNNVTQEGASGNYHTGQSNSADTIHLSNDNICGAATGVHIQFTLSQMNTPTTGQPTMSGTFMSDTGGGVKVSGAIGGALNSLPAGDYNAFRIYLTAGDMDDMSVWLRRLA